MDEMDPVPWDDLEAVSGPPADELSAYVEAADGTVESDAFDAVKRVYDEWKADRGDDRSLPDQGAAFVVAYLLEREGVIDLADSPQGSLVARRPSADRLCELFWEREYTLWWMAVELGVHYSLVTVWLWEADVPLAGRNITAETKEQIEARRTQDTTE